MHVAMGMLTQMILAERVLAYGNLKAEASLETEFPWKLSLPQANHQKTGPKLEYVALLQYSFKPSLDSQ